MKKVAIPISNNLLNEGIEGKVSFSVYSIQGREIKKQKLELTRDIEMLPFLLHENGITDVILFQISQNLLLKFCMKKINVFVGVTPQPAKELIKMYLEGTLKSDTSVIKKLINK